ncbi:ABC transporter permease [Mycoplasma nasistruthionis]|uniref:ABC transporter permease n=1 Tax=Mycoplasma nasistruthionis TaxID=353852 RepID=A0A5B7XVS0_9MOLU|nr:ABC transporter permease [Mycoplasma nasistruthionis]QCZ36892.1 ABC transporter permease [Mycoplasma nasistruthionis]
MKHLFKEVFRSLFKNKATVAGLTILVFLTSGIFTLLHDTAKAMKQQYQTIKNKSIAHDITVDLNLPANGNAYNDGYYINGLVQSDSLPSAYNKPLNYVDGPNYKELANVIDLKQITDSFLPLSHFVDKEKFKNKYIKRQDFVQLYSNYDTDNNNSSLITLNYDEPAKIFETKTNYVMDLYVKDMLGNYKNDTETITINNQDTFRLDKTYNLSDIAYISSSENIKVILSQLSSLFINTVTKEATFDLIKGQQWKLTNPVFTIMPDQIAKLLGFKKYENNENIFVVDKNTTPFLIDINSNDSTADFITKNLRQDIPYSNLFEEEFKTADKNMKFTFEIGQKYNLPTKWAAKQEKITYYQRKEYKTTFDDQYKNLWEGSYSTFMTEIENTSQFDEFKKFTYWNKSITTYLKRFNSNGELKDDREFVNESTPVVSMQEVNQVKLHLARREDQYGFSEQDNYKKQSLIEELKKARLRTSVYLHSNNTIVNDNVKNELNRLIEALNVDSLTTQSSLDQLLDTFNWYISSVKNAFASNGVENPIDLPIINLTNFAKIPDFDSYMTGNKGKTIAEIEGLSQPVANSDYLKLTNKNIKEEFLNKIKDGAADVVKKSIYEYIIKSKDQNGLGISPKNVGIKQTITVDAFDSDSNEKFVFHFVNVGDSERKINGIENNINKLVNEEINEIDGNLNINSVSKNLGDFFRTKQLEPYVSKVILDNVAINISPDTNYIKLDYEYVDIENTDFEKNKTTWTYGAKIYKLSHWIVNKPQNEITEHEANNFANLALTVTNPLKKEFLILEPVYNELENKITHYRNVSWTNSGDKKGVTEENAKQFANSVLTNDYLYSFLKQNNLTLKATLNPNGWVEKSNQFKNSVYVPFGYRAPLTDVVNEALSQGTLKKAVENIQINLLNTDLVKVGFLTKDMVYALTDSVDYSFEVNNFAKVFSSGEINLNVLPKLLLDGIYHLAHNPQGDYVRKILDNLFRIAKELILEKQTLEEQKTYLKEEIEKIFKVYELISGTDLTNFVLPITLVKFAKDPVVFIDSIIAIINSIDFVKFSDLSYEFFDNYYLKPAFEDDPKWIRKLSLNEILLWFLKSIDQEAFKQGLKGVLNNIDLTFLTDNQDTANPLISLFQNISPLLKELIKQINSYREQDQVAYQNVIDGLNYFINAFDLNIFIETLESKLRIEKFTETATVYNSVIDSKVLNTRYNAAGALSSSDFIYALLKSFFTLPGSNRTFKNELIKMLNLSSKGSSIKIKEDLYLTIPSADPNKLDYFDLVNAISNSATVTTDTTTNTVKSTKSLFEKTYDFIYFYLYLLTEEKVNEINFKTLTDEQRQPAFLMFNLDENSPTAIDKETAISTLKEWKNLFDLFITTEAAPTLKENQTLGNLFEFYASFKPSQTNGIWDLIRGALDKFIRFNSNSPYDAVSYGYPVYAFWLSIFEPTNETTIEERINFANALLELANKPETVESFNSFELFQPAAQNIVASDSTGFGVSRSLANPYAMRDLFFAKDRNNSYLNTDLQNLVNNNSKFTEFVNKNSLEITKVFSYIASSNAFDSFRKLNPKNNQFENATEYSGYALKYQNIYSVIINNLINGVFTNPLLAKHYETIDKILSSENPQFNLSALGISEALISPALATRNPQLLVWLLTDTNNIGEKGVDNANIAYLISNKLIDFSKLLNEGEEKTYEVINSLLKPVVKVPTFEKDLTFQIALDNDIIINWLDKNKNNSTDFSPFGVNLIDVLYKAINTVTGINKLETALKFDEIGSYVAKANYAWLVKNNKKVYTGKLPENPNTMLALVNSLPNDYKINVNGSDFIIIGDDLTYDNIYPVIDELNLQVNTKSQAVLYVNNQGFDRIKQAYVGNVVKEYLLIKNTKDTNLTNAELKNTLNNEVQNLSKDKTGFQRVYLDDELDGLNPERSIRITAIKGLIKAVDYVAKILLSILITLVSISIIFIIKRYISNKNKVIGILVAQGYTPLQIALSMTVFAFFTIVVGDLTGYLVGFLLQSQGIRILENYWTVPVQTLNFSPFSLIVNIVIPLTAMSILIIVVSLHSLRHKSIDLMSGITEIKIGEMQKRYSKLFKNKTLRLALQLHLDIIVSEN